MIFASTVNELFALSQCPDIDRWKKAIDFYIFVSYPLNLQNSHITSSSFYLVSLGFSSCAFIWPAPMHPKKSSSILFQCLYILSYFLSCSYLIKSIWTSETVLNNNGDSDHPCLLPDFNWNHSVFFHLELYLMFGFW